MKRSGVFPGSFDPFTSGHLDITTQALNIVDELYIIIAFNPEKDHYFDYLDRIDIVKESVEPLPDGRVHVGGNKGLTSDFINDYSIDVLWRGLRNNEDLLYEGELELFFNATTDVQTAYLTPHDKKHVRTSSSAVRNLLFANEVEEASKLTEVSLQPYLPDTD